MIRYGFVTDTVEFIRRKNKTGSEFLKVFFLVSLYKVNQLFGGYSIKSLQVSKALPVLGQSDRNNGEGLGGRI